MNRRSTDKPNASENGGGSTSRSLLRGLRRDDAESWVRLTVLYTPLVAHWCRQSHVPVDDVADVVQDVFQTVVRNIDGFEKKRETDSFRGWLRTIARSRIVDHFRRQRREPHGPGGTEASRRLQQLPEQQPPEDIELSDEPVFGTVLQTALSSIRDEFQDHTWQAFWGVAVQGRAAADVGAELEMQPGAVRVAKCRVLKRLRRELGERFD
jgi:RNA polymerase sigma-70 factor (ECF subfamily)